MNYIFKSAKNEEYNNFLSKLNEYNLINDDEFIFSLIDEADKNHNLLKYLELHFELYPVDINKKDKNNQTVLMYALSSSNPKMIYDIIIKSHPRMNDRNKHEESNLCYLCDIDDEFYSDKLIILNDLYHKGENPIYYTNEQLEILVESLSSNRMEFIDIFLSYYDYQEIIQKMIIYFLIEKDKLKHIISKLKNGDIKINGQKLIQILKNNKCEIDIIELLILKGAKISDIYDEYDQKLIFKFIKKI